MKIETNIETRKLQVDLAVSIVLVCISVLFGTLFLGYTVIRFQTPVWPPMGMDKVPSFYPTLSSVIIILSSFFYSLYNRSLAKSEETSIYFYLVFLLGIGFCVSQGFLWSQLHELHIYKNSGIWGSVLHGFTWIHFAHIVGSLIMMVIGAIKIIRQRALQSQTFFYQSGRIWHLLGMIWLIMYLGIFIF